MKKAHYQYIQILLCLILLIGTLTIFSGCAMKDDGTWMKCHKAQIAVNIGAAILTVLSALQVFIHKNPVKVLLSVSIAAGSVIVFLIPGILMLMCMMHTMRCYTLMQPFVRIISVLIAGFSVPGILSIYREGRKN